MDYNKNKDVERVIDIKKKRKNCDCLARGLYEECNSNNSLKTEQNHSISKSKLKEIASNKRVLIFDIEQRDYYLKNKNLSERNISKANVYHTLCGYHDKKLFFEIENGKEYIPGNKMQEFQYAYRAFIFNFSQQLIKRNYNLTHQVFEMISERDIILESKINDKFLSGFSNHSWEDIETTTVIINKEIKFISSFYARPIVTIKRFHMIGIESIAFNIFPQNGVTMILLSHQRDCKPRIIKYCKEIQRLSLKNPIKLQKYLTKLILVSDSNIAVNPDYYYSLVEERQKEFLKYALFFKSGNTRFWHSIMKILKLKFMRNEINLFNDC